MRPSKFGLGLAELNMKMAFTAAAGVAPGTAISTTPPWCLWNPTGSGKDLIILQALMGYVSGTLGAGQLIYEAVAGQVAAPTGGSELTVYAATLGDSAGVGRVFEGSTVAATPTLLRPAFFMGAFAGAAQIMLQAIDRCMGEFIVPPGRCIALQGSPLGAGTSPKVVLGMGWIERDRS